MVFTQLSTSEKDAFFGLLDEYFASRPEIFENVSNKESTPAKASALSAIQNVVRNAGPPPPVVPSWKRQNVSSSPDSAESLSSVNRVATAASAFLSANESKSPAPRPPPRRLSSYTAQEEAHEAAVPAPHVTSQTSKLVPQKKFGDVDVSSAKNMFVSLRGNKNTTTPPVAPPVPGTFTQKKNNFGPPPVRRLPSATPSAEGETKSASPPPPPPPPPRLQPEPEGEWAEALYAYTSDDPGDLELQAGQRVLIVERTSDDWWTGEIQGKRGLVPASYVQVA